MSAGSYFYPIKRDYLNLSGGTVTGETIFSAGFSANTIYSGNTNLYNIFRTDDVFVTGGTYSAGTATFYNNTGGTFSVTGFTTGDVYWISGSSGNFSIKIINDSGLDATGNYSLAEGGNTLASGDYSHVEGNYSIASGNSAHAEGFDTKAYGQYSHSEGSYTKATSQSAHAEGDETQALGMMSHAEGYVSIARGLASHVEGAQSSANTFSSHAEGSGTTTNGTASHAEGISTFANGDASHAGGTSSTANAINSFAHGLNNKASGLNSVALGGNNLTASTDNSVYVPYFYVASANTEGVLNSFLVRDDSTFEIRERDISSGLTLFSLSASSISGDTIYSGGTDLSNVFITTDIYWNSGSTGAFSIIAKNDSGIDAQGDYSLAEGYANTASGTYSHAEGDYNTASGVSSHVEGESNIANGAASHAEGESTQAIGDYSHSEGNGSIASGVTSHAEGYYTQANGENSHTEGIQTIASGIGAHAEGSNSIAIGYYSHAEGQGIATGQTSHAEGNGKAYGGNSHAEGQGTATGPNSHAEGSSTSSGAKSHAEGQGSLASGDTSHAEGVFTIAGGINSHSEGKTTVSLGDSSHAEGIQTQALTQGAHAEGYYSIARGYNSSYTANASHAEGISTIAHGYSSHAEGQLSIASGITTHAEGYNTQANGDYTHSEGYSTKAFGKYSHVEGLNSIASGQSSHAEGSSNVTYGSFSHAEGSNNIVYGNSSHVEGNGSIASGQTSHAGGNRSISNGQTSFAHGDSNIANGLNTAVIGGSNITGSTDNSTYVPYLYVTSINTGNTGTSLLSIESSGEVRKKTISEVALEIGAEFNYIESPVSPNLGDYLYWNGIAWINNPVKIPVSAGAGLSFFLESSGSTVPGYEFLSRFPTSESETIDSVTVNNNSVLIGKYASSELGRTQIDSGIWDFNTFLAIDLPIFSANTVVNIETFLLSSGGSETYLFSAHTSNIFSQPLTGVSLYSTSLVQSAFTANTTDSVVVKYYASTNNNFDTTISLYHGGDLYYSYINTPLVTLHNDLSGLQGGSSNEYYHLSSNQATLLTMGADASSLHSHGQYFTISGGTISGATNIAANFSANTIFSGSTNLSSIFAPINSGVQSISGGTNIITGGTASNPIINTSLVPVFTSVSATTYYGLPQDVYTTGGTFNNNSGTLSLNNSTGGTINISGFYVASADTDNYLAISGGTVTGATNFSNNLSATTIFSGSTNLGSIFALAGSGVQSVGQGTNIITGGTANNPIINTSLSPVFTSVSASTISGNTVTISGLSSLNGGITSSSFSGTTNRIVQSDTGGTFTATQQIITAYLVSGGTTANLLENVSNWDINGNYTGSTISGTYQGQKHYNNNYFFEAVSDNLFLRLIRG